MDLCISPWYLWGRRNWKKRKHVCRTEIANIPASVIVLGYLPFFADMPSYLTWQGLVVPVALPRQTPAGERLQRTVRNRIPKLLTRGQISARALNESNSQILAADPNQSNRSIDRDIGITHQSGVGWGRMGDFAGMLSLCSKGVGVAVKCCKMLKMLQNFPCT